MPYDAFSRVVATVFADGFMRARLFRYMLLLAALHVALRHAAITLFLPLARVLDMLMRAACWRYATLCFYAAC